MEIRIIGPGCSRCRRARAEAEKAVALAGVCASVLHVEDVRELLAFRVVSTPVVVVDGALRSSGRVPRAREIAEWLRPDGLR
jgi:small redox-active disulfide protein 2